MDAVTIATIVTVVTGVLVLAFTLPDYGESGWVDMPKPPDDLQKQIFEANRQTEIWKENRK